MKHKSGALIPLLLLLVALAAYANTFQVPFQFDDDANIAKNVLVQNPDFLIHPSRYCSQVHRKTTEGILCHYFGMRYVGYLTFGLNYAVHGLEVTGYHIVNLLIHLLNAGLLYGIVLITFRTPFLRKTSGEDGQGRWIALFAASLFAVHPVQTQAVTYIVQRFTSLATLFTLLSLFLYIRWRTAQPGNEGTRPSPGTRPLRRQMMQALLYAASLGYTGREKAE